jgi:hypothetical protein
MPVHLTALVKVLGELVYRFQCFGLNESVKSLDAIKSRPCSVGTKSEKSEKTLVSGD